MQDLAILRAGVDAIRWCGRKAVGLGRSIRYRYDRARILGVGPRPVPTPMTDAPEAERFLAEVAQLRDETLWLIQEIERHLSWGRWPRYSLPEYQQRVDRFLRRLDVLPDPVHRHLLESGWTEGQIREAATPVHIRAALPHQLESIRNDRMDLVKALDQSLVALRQPPSLHPYRG